MVCLKWYMVLNGMWYVVLSGMWYYYNDGLVQLVTWQLVTSEVEADD